MKRFIALMMCALSLGAAAQSTVVYPFNPDANSDGFVGVSDILEGVATYDNFFYPGEIMVGDTALSDWVTLLQFTLAQQQAAIDSLQNLVVAEVNADSSGNANNNILSAGQSLRWPLGYHGRPIFHQYSQGLFTVPSDSVLMITHGFNEYNGITYYSDDVVYGMSNTGPSITEPFPVGPGDAIELAQSNPWISGILVPKPNNVEVLFWDFSNGPFVVPNSKMFFAVWGDDGFGGGQIEGFLDGPVAATVQRGLLFPAGTELLDLSGFGGMLGFLLDTDHFKSTNSADASPGNGLGNSDDGVVIVDSLELRIQQLENLVSLINFGCKDPTACNYSADIDIDDGSCEGLLGCTDPLSDNYNVAATCDDGNCAPYVGMVDYGGIVYSVDNGTVRVLNIVEELSAGNQSASCNNAVSSLNSTTGSEGFSDWSLPSNQDWADICQEYNLISLLNTQNGGLQLDGTFIVSQNAYSQGGSNYYGCRYINSGGACNGSPSLPYEVCPGAKIRIVRDFQFGY